MRGLYRALPFFVVFLLLTPTIALAQTCTGPCQFITEKVFGFKSEWIDQPRELLVNAIIPALSVFVIFLAIQRAIGLNRMFGSLEYVIAVLVMFASMIPMGDPPVSAIGYWNTIMLAALGGFAFWGYAVIFVIAGVFYYWGVVKRSIGIKNLNVAFLKETNMLNSDLDDLKKKLRKAESEAINMNNGVRVRTRWQRDADRYRTKVKEAVDKINQLKEAYDKL